MKRPAAVSALCASLVFAMPAAAGKSASPADAFLLAGRALPRAEHKAPRTKGAAPNLRVEISVTAGELSDSAVFVVSSGSSANYTHGGDKHFQVGTGQGTGVEFKKWGFIANILAQALEDEKDKVSAQVQLELSGPVGKGEVRDVATWQFQSEFTLVKGRKTVIVESPGRAEITISDFSPE